MSTKLSQTKEAFAEANRKLGERTDQLNQKSSDLEQVGKKLAAGRASAKGSAIGIESAGALDKGCGDRPIATNRGSSSHLPAVHVGGDAHNPDRQHRNQPCRCYALRRDNEQRQTTLHKQSCGPRSYVCQLGVGVRDVLPLDAQSPFG